MATQRRPIPPPFSCQPTTLTVADRHPSKRFNLQGLPFSSVARSTSANGHDFKLVTKTARVHRLALFHSVFALITARQGAHLHALPSGAPYGEHFQQSSPIVATDDDGFQVVRLKKRNRLPNTSNRCTQRKSKPNISSSNRKPVSAGFTCKLQNPVTTYPDASSSPSTLSLGSPESSMIRPLQDKFYHDWRNKLKFQATISSNAKGVYLSITAFISDQRSFTIYVPESHRSFGWLAFEAALLQHFNLLRSEPCLSSSELKINHQRAQVNTSAPENPLNRKFPGMFNFSPLVKSFRLAPAVQFLQRREPHCHQQTGESYYLPLD